VHESSGLRFDVYERVHLPQDAAAIREIEEIELTPCVQAERQGEQVVLRGSLLLGGVYLPDDESRSSRQLEHWIPVEITLPQERVDRIEDLAVEVDNFDYDLLDGRTLNITGVLTLRGIRADSAGSRQQTYAWGEEPYTVVHRRGRELIGEEVSEAADEWPRADAGEGAHAAPDEAAVSGASAAAGLSDAVNGGAAAEADAVAAAWRHDGESPAEEADEPARGDPAAVPSAEAALSEAAAEEPQASADVAAQPSDPLDWKVFAAQAREQPASDGNGGDPEPTQAEEREAASESETAGVPERSAEETGEAAVGVGADAALAEGLPAGDVRNGAQPQDITASADGGLQAASGASELKVAFGAKREDGLSGSEGSTGLGNLFFPNRREARGEAGAKPSPQPQPSVQAQDDPQPSGDQDSAGAATRQTSSDEVDWRTLFRGAAAQETFRTVRLCIVQKDDTLDAIAGRYQRNPREIALANRLDGSMLTEGQVLYIP